MIISCYGAQLQLASKAILMTKFPYIFQTLNERLSMKWRLKSWPTEHYSEVKIELRDMEGETQLKLTQSLVPEAEFEQTSQGWSRYYWQPIRQTFGFGATIF